MGGKYISGCQELGLRGCDWLPSSIRKFDEIFFISIVVVVTHMTVCQYTGLDTKRNRFDLCKLYLNK